MNSHPCLFLTVIKHRHTIGRKRDNYRISKLSLFLVPSPKRVDWSLSPPSPPEPSNRVCHQQSSKDELPRLPPDQMGGATVSRFPCCVLSHSSLVFVMEHSRRWQLHIGGGKMFEPLFRAGLSFSGHFFCKIFVFDISNLNFRGYFLVWSAV